MSLQLKIRAGFRQKRRQQEKNRVGSSCTCKNISREAERERERETARKSQVSHAM